MRHIILGRGFGRHPGRTARRAHELSRPLRRRSALGRLLAEYGPVLAEPGAAFVTWKKDGRLRGCIGSVEPWRPLAEDVAQRRQVGPAA